MTTLNEQMREKAEKIVDEWDEWLQSAVNTEHTELHRKVLEAKIAEALQEAHAAGRRSDLEFETGVGRVKCHDESSVVFFSAWPNASQYVGKRLRVRIEVIS